MVANAENHTDSTPPSPGSPRSVAKHHLDRLRAKSEALNIEVQEFSQEFESVTHEPESLTALRAQADILSAEVRKLEHVFQNATGHDCQQEIWDAVQQALRKRYLAEVVSLRAAASLSKHGCMLPKLERRAARKHISSQGSDNASSTEMPLTSTDSDGSDVASPTASFGISSDASGGCTSDDSVSMETSYVLGTPPSPPKPMVVPSPKWLPPEATPAHTHHLQHCNTSTFYESDIEVPSPVCPDLRTPAKLPLPLEVSNFEHPYQLDDQQDIGEASCLSMSIEDWCDPEIRQIHSRPPPLNKESNKKATEDDQDHIVTAMEEDVQTALEVLGFRRCKGHEEESESLLSVFWPFL
jgi:hypothetical protein